MLETRKVDIRKDTQGAFRKPTSTIRNRYALEKCSGSGCVVLFIDSSVVSVIYR